MHLWPRNTMRAAYQEWQAQEKRLAEAQQRLSRQYLALSQRAEQVQIGAHQGLLRAARLLLDQPLSPASLMIKGQLQKAFALRGRGFCRRVPPALEVDLLDYATQTGKTCRRHNELTVRLRLAEEIITIFAEGPEFCRAPWFRLAVISPESAWLIFQLRQKRRKDRRAIQDCLSQSIRFLPW